MIVPSVTRSVVIAIAAITTHGSKVSTAPTAIPSQVKMPSQPDRSPTAASSAASRGDPVVTMNPNFIPRCRRP